MLSRERAISLVSDEIDRAEKKEMK